MLLAVCGDTCFYGHKPETLDSLLLALLPHHNPTNTADDQVIILLHKPKVTTKAAKLLAYLEHAIYHHLGWKFPLVSEKTHT